MKKFMIFSTIVALLAVVGLTVANFTCVTSFIDKMTQKTWKQRYDDALSKLESKANQYDKKLFDLKVKTKKEEIKNKKKHKELKKAEDLLVEFYTKLETVSDGEFVFHGSTYTAEKAQKQKQHWLTEVRKLRLETQRSDIILKNYKKAIEKMEKVIARLDKRIGELREQGEKLALQQEIAKLKSEIRKMENADSGAPESVSDADMSEIKTLISEANTELENLQIQEEVAKEEFKREQKVSQEGDLRNISDVIADSEEKTNSLENMDKEFLKKAKSSKK